MNINSAFPSKFLKASDLHDETHVVKIVDVKVEEVGQNKETKPVAYFEGKKKGMVLNKTNSRKIAQIAGSPETEDWVGTEVAIFPTETEFGGESVECIRVKAPKGTKRLTADDVPPPSDDDNVGF